MSGSLIRRAILLFGLIGFTASAPGIAQTTEASAEASTGLEEIVVTATRREERLQDVPISVSSFSQEQLDAQGLRNIDDLTRLSPGVTFLRTGVGSSGNFNDESTDISIRGIDSSAGTSTTAVYIDDTPIQSHHIVGSYNAFPALFDLDRVEVLRGPQGTLFGASAEGGALRFLTPQPSVNQSSGYLRSEFGSTRDGDPSYEVGAAVGGPLIDDALGFRVSASYRRDGGWVDRVDYTRPDPADPLSLPVYANTTEPNANWQETVTARAALKWQANDAVSLTPSVYYQRLAIHDTAGYWEPLSNPSGGVYRNGDALRDSSTDPFWLSALRLDWNLGFGQLVSNTSYYSRDQRSVSDLTQLQRGLYASFGLLANIYPQPGDHTFGFFADKQNNFYQEVRIASSDAHARVTWNTGIYYAHTNENVPENVYDLTIDAETAAFAGAANSACASFPCPNGYVYANPIDRVIEKQLAWFGELSVRIVDTLKATVGLRVSKNEFSGSSLLGGAAVLIPLTAPTDSEARFSENPVTPKFVLAWQPNSDNNVYLSASKGYRTGGTNVGIGTICETDLAALGLPLGPDGIHHAVPPQYSSDSLWSYEIGAKDTLLDRRLQINSSIYFVNWSNIQQNVYLPSCGEQFVANLGQVHSKGGEVEVNFRPIEPLTFGVTVTHADAHYTNASCAGILQYNGVSCVGPPSGPPVTYAPIVTAGDRLVGAPWVILLSSEYAAALPVLNGRKGYVRVDYQRANAQTAPLPGQDPRNAVVDTTIPGLPETNDLSLRLGLRFTGWDLSVFGNNLTNEHPLLFASRDVAIDSVDNLYYGRSVRPRTLGVTASYRY
jgi:iron complex outermembrane receptor protein